MTGNAADPGSWNKYAYTGGDPTNRVDSQREAIGSVSAAIYPASTTAPAALTGLS